MISEMVDEKSEFVLIFESKSLDRIHHNGMNSSCFYQPHHLLELHSFLGFVTGISSHSVFKPHGDFDTVLCSPIPNRRALTLRVRVLI